MIHLFSPPDQTLFIGKHLLYMPSCHSTNDIAQHILQKGEDFNGTIVITDHQTAGRGQINTSWEASPGLNLTFSVILHLESLAVNQQFFLQKMVSLALHDTLTTYLPASQNLFIKWPNDIFYENKKIAGILIQNQLAGQTIKKSIIGIGLNVNQKQFSIPQASSLSIITNNTFALPIILHEILHALEKRYLQLRQYKLDILTKDYLSFLMGLDKVHTFQDSKGHLFQGTIINVETSGQLCIKTSTGALRTFWFKEVKFF